MINKKINIYLLLLLLLLTSCKKMIEKNNNEIYRSETTSITNGEIETMQQYDISNHIEDWRINDKNHLE